MKKTILVFLFVVTSTSIATGQTSSETTRRVAEYISKGKLQKAVKFLDRAIARRKDTLDAYKMRARIREFSGDQKGAISDLSNAIKMYPEEAILYLRRGDLKAVLNDSGALADYSKAIKLGYKTDRVFVARAKQRSLAEQGHEAAADFRTALEINPNSVGAAVGLARELNKDNRIDEAITFINNFLKERMELNRDVRISGQRSTKITLIGTSLTPEFNDAPEISSLKSAHQLKRQIGVSFVYAELADLLLQKKRFDEALKNVEKSLRISYENGFARGVRGKIYLAKKDYRKAIEDLSFSIKKNIDDPSLYSERGISYLLLGETEKAQTDFDTYVKIVPENETSLKNGIAEATKKAECS